jgi:replicative DNA helicase
MLSIKTHTSIYFEAIVQLFTETQPIDLNGIGTNEEKNAKLDLAGGDFYLIQLTQKNFLISP